MLRILLGDPEGKRLRKDLGIDGRVILKCIIKIWVMRMLTGFIWLRIVTSGRLL
jgi:hypothetical protein